MKVNVAGAGAGKTTVMSKLITQYKIPEGKVLFCIAFTNAAAEIISTKVADKLGYIPDNIKIGTIHSFLYQEFVAPYYVFLYKKHYEQLSNMVMPNTPAFRSTKISELEQRNILHITKIPERAKWVVSKKTGDTPQIKKTREKVLSNFKKYCAAIFVDEAQDISNDIKSVFLALDKAGIEIHLYGDPKQDVKGFGCFREIIDSEHSTVTYINNCYRCPQAHLNLSNTLASKAEIQISGNENPDSRITALLESEIDICSLFEKESNTMCYISKTNDRFVTNAFHGNKQFEALFHEINVAINEKWKKQKTELEIRRAAYYVTESILTDYQNKRNGSSALSRWIQNGTFDYPGGKRYAQMKTALELNDAPSENEFSVRSIESIKGLESGRCLFILTTDLAPYLFQKKTEDNKTKHLLYVALTRSSNELIILFTKEVEAQYGKTYIMEFMSQYQ